MCCCLDRNSGGNRRSEETQVHEFPTHATAWKFEIQNFVFVSMVTSVAMLEDSSQAKSDVPVVFL